MNLSKPDYLPKAPSLNTTTLVVSASTYEFGGKVQFSPQHQLFLQDKTQILHILVV